MLKRASLGTEGHTNKDTMNALIGSAGFVGGHIDQQHEFTHKFNRRNIADARGCRFDTVVCAAAPGSMFEANKFPDRDEDNINSLIESIYQVSAKQFVLISTIAVLDKFDAGADESTAAFQTSLAYGRNRRALEKFCASHFQKCLVVRLPALFGVGLKKNFLFDILNPMPSILPEPRFNELLDRLPEELRETLSSIYRRDLTLNMMAIDRKALDESGLRRAYDEAVTDLGLSAVRFTNPDTRFQYYDISKLWCDIGVALRANLHVVHLAPEPLVANDVYKALAGQNLPSTDAGLHREDMRTRHAALWGKEGPYIVGAGEVLARLRAFFEQEKARK